MPRIEPADPNNLPEASRPLMEQAKDATGGLELEFFKQMAVSPAAFEAYLGLGGGLSKSSLSQELQEELSISVSDYNGCHY
jgi:predicted Zn-dependent peptidase